MMLMPNISNFFRICNIILMVGYLGFVLFLTQILFNFQFFMVSGISMLPTLKENQFVLISQKYSYNVGDICAYEYKGAKIIHRLYEIKYQNGRLIYIFKGDNNKEIDNTLVYIEQIIGAKL